jgi:hypothetical protein
VKRFLVLFILITGCDFTKEPYPHKIFPKELKGIWITKTDTSIYKMVFLDSNHVMVSTFGKTIMSYKILPKTNYSLFNMTQMSGRDSIDSILCSVFWSDCPNRLNTIVIFVSPIFIYSVCHLIKKSLKLPLFSLRILHYFVIRQNNIIHCAYYAK